MTALPHLHWLARCRPSAGGRLAASYPVLIGMALLVGRILRLPAGPLLAMAILLAANAVVLALALHAEPLLDALS
jgi:hypothetical protein